MAENKEPTTSENEDVEAHGLTRPDSERPDTEQHSEEPDVEGHAFLERPGSERPDTELLSERPSNE